MFKFNSFRFQRQEKVSTVWLHCEVQVCDGERITCQPVSVLLFNDTKNIIAVVPIYMLLFCNFLNVFLNVIVEKAQMLLITLTVALLLISKVWHALDTKPETSKWNSAITVFSEFRSLSQSSLAHHLWELIFFQAYLISSLAADHLIDAFTILQVNLGWPNHFRLNSLNSLSMDWCRLQG